MARIPLNKLQLPKDEGGLRLTNFMAKQKSFKIRWIFKAINGEFLSEVMVHQIIPTLGHFIWKCNLQPQDIPLLIHKQSFWTQVLEA